MEKNHARQNKIFPPRLSPRHIDKCVEMAGLFALLLILASLGSLVLLVIWRGLPAMSIDMLTQAPKGGFCLETGGGVLNAILGTLYLSFGAVLLAGIVALPLAVVLQKEYARGSSWAVAVRFGLDMLWGIPSIVFGAFGFLLMVQLHIGVSLLAGILTLSLVVLPIMVRTMDEVLAAVPRSIFEPSFGLGSTRLEAFWMVISRQALPGLAVGIILGLGRAMGDAASVLFTAGYTRYIPEGLLQPVASLPLAVFNDLQCPLPSAQERAYASAFILLVLVVILTATSRMLSRRFERNMLL